MDIFVFESRKKKLSQNDTPPIEELLIKHQSYECFYFTGLRCRIANKMVGKKAFQQSYSIKEAT